MNPSEATTQQHSTGSPPTPEGQLPSTPNLNDADSQPLHEPSTSGSPSKSPSAATAGESEVDIQEIELGATPVGRVPHERTEQEEDEIEIEGELNRDVVRRPSPVVGAVLFDDDEFEGEGEEEQQSQQSFEACLEDRIRKMQERRNAARVSPKADLLREKRRVAVGPHLRRFVLEGSLFQWWKKRPFRNAEGCPELKYFKYSCPELQGLKFVALISDVAFLEGYLGCEECCDHLIAHFFGVLAPVIKGNDGVLRRERREKKGVRAPRFPVLRTDEIATYLKGLLSMWHMDAFPTISAEFVQTIRYCILGAIAGFVECVVRGRTSDKEIALFQKLFGEMRFIDRFIIPYFEDSVFPSNNLFYLERILDFLREFTHWFSEIDVDLLSDISDSVTNLVLFVALKNSDCPILFRTCLMVLAQVLYGHTIGVPAYKKPDYLWQFLSESERLQLRDKVVSFCGNTRDFKEQTRYVGYTVLMCLIKNYEEIESDRACRRIVFGFLMLESRIFRHSVIHLILGLIARSKTSWNCFLRIREQALTKLNVSPPVKTLDEEGVEILNTVKSYCTTETGEERTPTPRELVQAGEMFVDLVRRFGFIDLSLFPGVKRFAQQSLEILQQSDDRLFEAAVLHCILEFRDLEFHRFQELALGYAAQFPMDRSVFEYLVNVKLMPIPNWNGTARSQELLARSSADGLALDRSRDGLLDAPVGIEVCKDSLESLGAMDASFFHSFNFNFKSPIVDPLLLQTTWKSVYSYLLGQKTSKDFDLRRLIAQLLMGRDSQSIWYWASNGETASPKSLFSSFVLENLASLKEFEGGIRAGAERPLKEYFRWSLGTMRACSQCGRQGENHLRCSRCKTVYYCNVRCQRRHWRRHKSVCQVMSAEECVFLAHLEKKRNLTE